MLANIDNDYHCRLSIRCQAQYPKPSFYPAPHAPLHRHCHHRRWPPGPYPSHPPAAKESCHARSLCGDRSGGGVAAPVAPSVCGVGDSPPAIACRSPSRPPSLSPAHLCRGAARRAVSPLRTAQYGAVSRFLPVGDPAVGFGPSGNGGDGAAPRAVPGVGAAAVSAQFSGRKAAFGPAGGAGDRGRYAPASGLGAADAPELSERSTAPLQPDRSARALAPGRANFDCRQRLDQWPPRSGGDGAGCPGDYDGATAVLRQAVRC